MVDERPVSRDVLETRIAVLRKWLGFYAEAENYVLDPQRKQPRVMADAGYWARYALQATAPVGEG